MPTNVSTSFFFINLLFQARRAGSNPRPSCIPRCVAARDKLRPGRRAYGSRSSRGLCTFAAQCLGSQFAPMAARCRSCSSKDIAHVRGVWLVGDWKSRAYFAVRGRTGQVAPMATGYGPRSSKDIVHVRGGWLVGDWKSLAYFAVRGRTGQVAPGAAGLWLVLIERVVYVREVWLVGDWKGLAIGEFGRAQCIWIGQNPRAGWGQGAVLGFPFQAGRSGNSSERDSFLVSFAQKLDAKNTGIPVKQRERHFAVILVG